MKLIRILAGLLIAVIGIMSIPWAALAAETPTPTPPPEKIQLNPTYPKIENIAGAQFTFEVELVYTGEGAKVFDLQATSPKGWTVFMTPQYQKDTRISSIRIEPAFGSSTKISLIANAPFYPLPDPGNYPITLTAASGSLKGSTQVTAVITARYQLNLASTNELLNTTAQATKDNFFSIKVQNLSTAPVDKINLSSTKPDGWTITFNPDKVDSLNAFDEKTVDVNIKPAAKTIAGDYMITLSASGTQSSAQQMNIRVTVETSSVWGWVGVAIIAVVILGLAFVFMKFSRR